MRMKAGDFFDRYTILLMKAQADEGARRELSSYAAEVRVIIQEGPMGEELLAQLMLLMEANAKTWATESGLRASSQLAEDLSVEQLADVGRKAIRIREYNKRRVAAKAAIDRMFGDIPDNKVDHASE